jgi:uncharacterized membrane protein
VGDGRKFDQAVLLQLNAEAEIYKLGFVTQQDLSSLGLPQLVAIYVPDSYNFSGDLFLVPASKLQRLDKGGADMMKFIVSGGVSGLGAK